MEKKKYKYRLTEQNRHLADNLQDTYIDEENGILWSDQDLTSLGFYSQEDTIYNWLVILLGIIVFSVLFIPMTVPLIQGLYLSTNIIPKPIYCQSLYWEQREVEARYNKIITGVENSKKYGFESPETEARFFHEKNIREDRKESMDKAIAWCKN